MLGKWQNWERRILAEKTRFDNIFVKIKNNPVLAIIIALEAISKKGFWFKFAARPGFPRKAWFRIHLNF